MGGAYLRWNGGRWHCAQITMGAAGNDIVEGVAAVPVGHRLGFGLNTDHSFIAAYRA